MHDPASRRRFLQSLGLTAAAATLSHEAVRGADDPAPPAPEDLPRDLAPQHADLGSLYADIWRLAKDRPFPQSFLGDRYASLAEFKQASREKVLDVLGYRPEKVDPEPELVERLDRGDFWLEKITFRTTPDFRVPALVLIPKRLAKPAPAVVDLHSHGGMFLFGKEKVVDLGQNHPAMVRYHQRNYEGRPTSTALVRRGYVVISIDTFMFGERRVILDRHLQQHGWDRANYSEDVVGELNQVCRGKEDTLAKSLVLAGLTWPGIVCWDDMRTVDYLQTREEVDPARIACCGVSMGGYRAAYLAGLDERIKAACVVGFMSTVRPMMQRHIDTHSWVHFLPNLHRYLDLPDVVSMMAPKPLMVQQCRQDGLFPLSGMQASVQHIAAVYKKAGVAEQFDGRFYDRPHQFAIDMQDDCFAFFDQHLRPAQG